MSYVKSYFSYLIIILNSGIPVPPEVESCIPFAEQHIERLLDKYTLNYNVGIRHEWTLAQISKQARAIAKKRMEKKSNLLLGQEMA